MALLFWQSRFIVILSLCKGKFHLTRFAYKSEFALLKMTNSVNFYEF